MKTILEGMAAGSPFDPRAPHESKYKRDPQKIYDNFMAAIPKATDIVSLKKRESYPGFIQEALDALAKKLDDLKSQFDSFCCTFEVIKKENLIKKIDKVRELLDTTDFGMKEIRAGIIDSMNVEGVLFLTDMQRGGGRKELHDATGAVVNGFKRLLEVF